MLSAVPLLSYSDPLPDLDGYRSLSTRGLEGGENSPSSAVRQMSTSTTSERPQEGRRAKTGAGTATATGTGRKKRRPSGARRVSSSSSTKKSSESSGRNGATSDEKKRVEELVSKVTAHAKAIQAVKKAVFQIQVVLLRGVKEQSQLQHARPLLTQDEYSDVVTERSIAKLCGYPLCEKELLPEKARKGRYRISLREHKVYDLSETGLFCGTDCLIASKTFQSSLEVQRDDIMGKKKLISIVHSVCDPGTALNNNIHHHGHHKQQDRSGVMGGKDQQQDDRAVLSDGSALMSGIYERVDILGTSSFGDDDGNGPFDAIEGYVPQNSQRYTQQNNTSTSSVANESALPVTQEGIQVKGGARALETCSGNKEQQGEENPRKQVLQLDENGKTLAAVLSHPDDEVQGESPSTPRALKSALRRKGTSESKVKRNVSWQDRTKKDQTAEKKKQNQQHPSVALTVIEVKSKARPTHPSPTAVASAPTSDNTTPQDLSSNESGISIAENPMPKSGRKDTRDTTEGERNAEVSTSVRTEELEKKCVLASEEAVDGGGSADASLEIDGLKRVLAPVGAVITAGAAGEADNVNLPVEVDKSERILATGEAAVEAPAPPSAPGPTHGRDGDSGSGSGEEVPVVLEKSERVVAAEEVAAALIEAAEAAACGRIGSAEAVETVGLSIVPESENDVKETMSDGHGHAQALALALGQNEDEGSFNDSKKESPSSGSLLTASAEVDVRWPQLESKEEEEDDDLGTITTKGAWHDAPPRRFKVEVSMFGTIWMALDEWISAATVAHLYGKEPQLFEDDFLVANGREYRRRQVPSAYGGLSSTSAAISKAFSACLSQAFPDVVRGLKLSVPLSTMEQNLGRLIRTMTFIEALPAFGGKEWSLILTLMLDALSVQRLPSLGLHLAKNVPLRRKFLDTIEADEAEYETFRAILLPLGPTINSLN